VASERAGQRVMQSITQYLEQRLKLRVNRDKSAVGRATKRPFLGFAFFSRDGQIKVRLAPKARHPAQARGPGRNARSWGVSMDRRIRELNRFTIGWTNYFALAETPSVFDELDEWLRRRLRQIRWKEWKRPRTRWRNLRTLGTPEQKAREWAFSEKGYW